MKLIKFSLLKLDRDIFLESSYGLFSFGPLQLSINLDFANYLRRSFIKDLL